MHQGSALNSLLFNLMIEVLLQGEFRNGIPWDPPFANDLAVVADSLEECISKLKNLKNGMQSKCIRVNMRNTKFMIAAH